jgi:predicted glycosyltransferase
MTRSVLILVTHLLGVGHLTRAAALGRGLAAAGYNVSLVTGGRPAPLVPTTGLHVVQLPPVHCVGVDFSTLLGSDGVPIGEDVRQARIAAILAELDRCNPDIVITETYPFGRRQLAGEFRALVAAARHGRKPTTILASIRDILNPPAKPARAAEAESTLAAFYDGVLVHGDREVTPLSASWPTTQALDTRLHYTGYIADIAGAKDGTETEPRAISSIEAEPLRDILVSGGGSAASLPLYRAAIGAASLHKVANPWRILVGHGVAQADFDSLVASAGANVVVERARPDFTALLAGAALSISQAGYNTMIDLGRAGVPAIVVPFEQGREAEQRLRAERFQALGLAHVVNEVSLTPARLAQAVSIRLAAAAAPALTLDIDGIAGSVRAIETAVDQGAHLAAAWQRLDARLAQHTGRPREFWWRDDDAIAPSGALDTLLALAGRHGVPLALATIPAMATPQLAERLATEEGVDILVHGYRHANHAPADRKKQELGYRVPAEILGELSTGLSRLRGLFGTRCLPVLVPPWNRIQADLVPALAVLGFGGLSTYGRRPADREHGLTIANTHCDPVDWKRSGNRLWFADVLDRLCDSLDLDEPLGLLTHHLVHDAWEWAFLDRLLATLTRHPQIRFISARQVFGP